MAVDKNLEPFEVDVEDNPSESELKVEVVNPDAVSIETEDGGVVVDFEGNATEELMGADHNSNLAEYIEDQDLEEMASDLVSDFNFMVFGARKLFKHDPEAHGVTFPKYEPLASLGDPIPVSNSPPITIFSSHSK